MDSAKAAYMATCIEKGITRIEKYNPANVSKNETIYTLLPPKLNKLKKTNMEAFFYWKKIEDLLI